MTLVVTVFLQWNHISGSFISKFAVQRCNIIGCKQFLYFFSSKKMKFKKVTHIIFDMDGLLLDSETTHDKIMEQIGSKYGKQYPDSLKIKMLGRTERDIGHIAVEDMKLPISVDEFLALYFEKERELQNPELMPGAKNLVQHLKKNNIPIAVATSSCYDAMVLKTKKHQDVFKLFNHIVCGGNDPEVKHGKPAPDIYLICASRFPDKPSPENCLVFEDAPNGVKGATAAGMQTVMVPPKEVSDNDRKLATLVLNSLEDFQPELFGLPPRK